MDIIKLDDFKNIYCVNNFQKEWRGLFKKDTKSYERYAEWLDRHLHYLDEDPVFFSNNNKNFECVINSNPHIHSIHGRSKKNPRVLYYLLTNNNKVVLLTSFLEKNKSDYKIAKRRAEERAEQL